MSLDVAQLYGTVGIKGASQSVRDLQSVSSQVDKTQGVLSGLSKNAGQIGQGIGQVGAGLVRVGEKAAVAIVGIGIAASKVGIDFQDAFAGVRKTVTGSEADLDSLYESLKKLSTRVPVKFTDLAGIAQEAGALGVATKDVTSFTEAVARVSAATVGLDTATASEAFGKLGNIFHLKGSGYSQLGSALVELGNSAASSEGDIIEVAKRFGAAGSAAGLSAAQVLGWSSAIASLGPEAEAAGSSLGRLFGRVIQFAGTGNPKFKEFAATAGMSTKAFKELLGTDASGAMQKFVEGLAKLDKFTLAKTLKDAGITNIRDINAIQLLAQNTDLLSSSITTSSKAWKDNTALVDVSEKKFDTFKSHLVELANTALAGADSFSQGLNPALDRLSKKAATFVGDHTADFKRLGTELGNAIDKIDWDQVARAAGSVVDVVTKILDVVKQIPLEVDAAIVAFLGINKLSGGLIGSGLGNIAGGIAGAAGNIASGLLSGVLSKVPVIGGALASVGAQRVFVVNWPAGGLGGGLPLPAAAAGGSSALALLGATGIAAAIVVAAVPIGQAFASVLPDWLKGGPGPDTGKTQSQLAREAADRAKQAQNPSSSMDQNLGKAADDIYHATHPFTDFAHNAGKALDDLAIGTKVATGSLLRTLKHEEEKILGKKHGSDPKSHAFHVPQKTYIEQHTNANAVTIVRDFVTRMLSGKSHYAPDKVPGILTAMKGLQQRFLAIGDTHNAHLVGTQIKLLKGSISKDIADAKAKVATGNAALKGAVLGVGTAIKAVDMLTKVNFNVDGRQYESVLVDRGWQKAWGRRTA